MYSDNIIYGGFAVVTAKRKLTILSLRRTRLTLYAVYANSVLAA